MSRYDVFSRPCESTGATDQRVRIDGAGTPHPIQAEERVMAVRVQATHISSQGSPSPGYSTSRPSAIGARHRTWKISLRGWPTSNVTTRRGGSPRWRRQRWAAAWASWHGVRLAQCCISASADWPPLLNCTPHWGTIAVLHPTKGGAI